MKFSTIAACALGVLAVACAPKSNNAYTVTTPVDAEKFNGQTAYIMNLDSDECIDSVVVSGDTIVFTGEVAQPVLARVMFGNVRGGVFVLEPGDITFDEKMVAVGTPGNASLQAIGEQQKEIMQAFRKAENDSVRGYLQKLYGEIADSLITNEANSPVGLFVLLNNMYSYTPEQLDSLAALYPVYGGSTKVQKLQQTYANAKATAEGNMFVDFTIEGENPVKFSDYVGNGKYTLVDFWASWCGPCRAEIPNIKEVYKKYNGDKFQVLGVAVWDKPEDTQKAIEELGIEWPCIINAQSIPTDLYGITGIPQVMLIGPDGTILSRNLRGDVLRATVASAMEQ